MPLCFHAHLQRPSVFDLEDGFIRRFVLRMDEATRIDCAMLQMRDSRGLQNVFTYDLHSHLTGITLNGILPT